MNPSDMPVRFSRLKRFAASALHYRHSLTEDWNTPSLEFGRAGHAMVLGGAEVIPYEGIRRGKSWEQFFAEHEGKEILTVKDYDRCRRAADAVLACELARPFLVGKAEIAIDWQMLGRKCSSRLDVLGDGFVTELKFCRSSHPERFKSQARWLAYPAQVAFYQDAAATLGRHCPRGIIIAVESQAPFPVTVLELTPRALEQGRRQVRAWFEQLLIAEAEDRWPPYAQSIVEFDAPEDDPELQFADDDEEAA